MNKIYALVDCDENKIIAVSKNKADLEELMYDCFEEDVEYDWLWRLSWGKYPENELPALANMAYYETLDWYNSCIGIVETVEV